MKVVFVSTQQYTDKSKNILFSLHLMYLYTFSNSTFFAHKLYMEYKTRTLSKLLLQFNYCFVLPHFINNFVLIIFIYMFKIQDCTQECLLGICYLYTQTRDVLFTIKKPQKDLQITF